MITKAWVLGMLMMAQQNSDLVVETLLSQEKDETHIHARLKNQGQAPLIVVLDDFYCQIETRLFDSKGRPLEPRDRRAAQGRRRTPDSVTPAVIPPGGSVDLETFWIWPARSAAGAGPLSWELQAFAGQMLKVEFSYLLLKEQAALTETKGAAGAVVGQWTSPRVSFSVKPLTAKEVRAVLSEKRVVKDAAAVPLLIEALAKAKDPDTREYAAVSLGELNAQDAAGALATALRKDKVRDVRLYAAYALITIASMEALDALIDASTQDEDDLVRHRATEALALLADPRAVEAVIHSGALQGEVLSAMASRLPQKVLLEGARQVLNGEAKARPRGEAVELLAKLPGAGLRLALILRSVHDGDPGVRLNAIRAAGASKHPRAIPELIKWVEDKDSGFEARSALADLTGENPGDGAEAWKTWWEERGREKYGKTAEPVVTWWIEGKEASRKDFEKLARSLTDAGGHYCKETLEGGVNGHHAKDGSGAVCEIKCTTDLEGIRNSIQKRIGR